MATNSNTNDRKPAGWFSRRHSTNEAHKTARDNYLSKRGKAHRQGVAAAYDDEVVRGKCGHKHGKRQLGSCPVVSKNQ